MFCERALVCERTAAVKMVVVVESRGTPSYVSPVMQSPRYGGCVSSFFNLFDWPSAKRLSSTRRLPAGKTEKGSFRRARSFRTDHGKTRMRHDESAAPPMRPPGVVARLMGLESLPEAPYPRHRRSQGSLPDSSPVLLQDLLQQDFKPSKPNKSLRERLFRKRTTRRQYASRKGSLTAFRCRSEEWCISPAFVDIPQAQSRFMYSVTQKQKPFLSRLPVSGEAIPELSLLQARSAGRDVLLQGWPLGGQHNVPPDLYHETEASGPERPQESESVGSKPTDSASSKPLLMNSKMAHGRRRSSSWNGSEDSDSTIEGPPSRHRRTGKKASPPSQQSQAAHHTNRRTKPTTDPDFRASRRRGSARSPGDRQPLMIPAEISRTSISLASTATSQSSSGEFRSVTSKPPPGQGRGSRAQRPSGKSGKNSPVKNASSQAGKTPTTPTTPTAATAAKVKSKEHLVKSPAMAPGKPPPDKASKAKSKGSPSLDPPSDVPGDRLHHVPLKPSLPSHSKLVPSKPPSCPKLQRFTEKAAAGGILIKPKGNPKVAPRVEDVGARLQTGNQSNAEDMATPSEDPVVSTSKRTNPSQAKSVDALFPELPLDRESQETDTIRLRRPVDRVLFSPDFDFTEASTGEATQISMSPLIDYDELGDPGEFGQGGSRSPLVDAGELQDDWKPLAVDAYPVCWEDEIVETILSGRCCERSCSGPSISSRSLTFSEEERNGDSWSSCASYDPQESESPREGRNDSTRTNLQVFHLQGRTATTEPHPHQVKDLEVEAEASDQEPKSPPAQFVQKILEESTVDEVAEQPSPVSVLQSPFHDETCTTSESSPESTRKLSSDATTSSDREMLPSTSARIKQALIDISTFRLATATPVLAPPSSLSPPRPPRSSPLQDEPRFIAELLSAAHFLCTPGSSPPWHSRDLAMDPCLFDQLESEGGAALATGGLWRCDRKLLFDCVNEAVAVSARRWRGARGHGGEWGVEPGDPGGWWRQSQPRGQELVRAVGKTIADWRQVAAVVGDALVARDLSVHLGHWRFLAPEAVGVGVEIETMVWGGLLEEIVVDFVAGKAAGLQCW